MRTCFKCKVNKSLKDFYPNRTSPTGVRSYCKECNNSNRSRTYRSWECMKQRCLNKNSADYDNYMKRGIVICNRWLVFKNFLADMGERPNNTSLDRVDNNGNYEPSNCRWASPREQRMNQRRQDGIQKNTNSGTSKGIYKNNT